jgi:coenzyme F420-dependent glucose-6-phosphate dehydrogenase
MAQFYFFLGHEQLQPEQIVEYGRLVEEAGFDGVMVSEHFQPWVDDAGAGGFAFSTLGALAVATTRVKLMTAVTTPLFRYHPAVVAQAAATIDRLSQGRFELGVGTGENLNEGVLGLNFPAYSERAARMAEALTIMRQLLDGQKVTHDGHYYQTTGAKLYSPPISRVPIYMAAGGPKSASLAGKSADGVITSVKDIAATQAKVIGPATEAAGQKPPRIIANRWTVFGHSEDEQWEALKPWRGLRAPNRLTETDPAVLRQSADQLDRREVLSSYTLVTGANDYIEAYRPLVTDLRADAIGIQTTSTDLPATIRLIGREVLPNLRALP